ncbi:hypothetical protein EB001_27875 [bacterium]|nr:hypothetical protein [bacterium]
MTKTQIINKLKADYPTINKMINGESFVLSEQEYNQTLDEWANAIILKQQQIAEIEAKAEAKAELLERLGLTQEEFNTLTA